MKDLIIIHDPNRLTIDEWLISGIQVSDKIISQFNMIAIIPPFRDPFEVNLDFLKVSRIRIATVSSMINVIKVLRTRNLLYNDIKNLKKNFFGNLQKLKNVYNNRLSKF